MNRTIRRDRSHSPRIHLISGRIREQRRRVTAPLRRGVFLVPATITSLGLLSGFYSAISSLQGHFELAAVMIAVAFVCDGLDGRIARASRTSSQFGIEYDSLSDVVAFGVAPAILSYSWALKPIGNLGVAVAGLFVVCGALRLARFNVQTGSVDKRRFVGLPIPGAALMIAGIALAYSYFEFESPRALCALMTPITLILGGLMISSVPYPSFKGLHLHGRAPVELMAVVLVVAGLLFAMPQLTLFLGAAAFVASGPILFARGERTGAAQPVEQTVASKPDSGQSKRTGALSEEIEQTQP